MTSAGASTTPLISGEWAGHYELQGALAPQRMTLEFADGVLRGDGVDEVGTFALEGGYGTVRGELRVGWIKTYDRGHSVLYRGNVNAAGALVGTWRIEETWQGGFAVEPVLHSNKKGLL